MYRNSLARVCLVFALVVLFVFPTNVFAQQAPLYSADFATDRPLPEGPTRSAAVTTRFANGGYEISTTPAGNLVTFAPGAAGPFSSFVSTVEFERVEGDEAVAGLMLIGSGPASYMVAVFPASREVQVLLVAGGDFTPARPAVVSDAVLPSGRNRLSVTSTPGQISVAVNGQDVISFPEGTFGDAAGFRTGITAGTRRSGPSTVRFYSLVIDRVGNVPPAIPSAPPVAPAPPPVAPAPPPPAQPAQPALPAEPAAPAQPTPSTVPQSAIDALKGMLGG